MKNLKRHLALQFSKSELVYRLHLLFNKSLRKSILNSKLISTGLPRCGNTLLSRKLRICFIQYKQLSHHHSLGHLKYLLRTGKPFIFCYRNPMDFIPSWHLKSGISVGTLIKYADEYFDVLSNARNCLIVPFDLIISEELDYLHSLGAFFEVDSFGVREDLIRYANESVKSDDRNPLVSTFPNKTKQIAKELVVRDYYTELKGLTEKSEKICVV